MGLPAVIKALLKPSAYAEACGKITFLQTHISYIFLTDKYAYKIKKPVDFGFLDFTAIEKRLYFCKEEVRLNRRLAPDIYLNVTPITRVRGGYRVGGTGRVVEYAVKMKRIPDKVILERMIKDGTITTEVIKRVAEKIAAFHKDALTNKGISGFGEIEIIRQNIEENFSQVSPFTGTAISNKRLDKIRSYAGEFLEKNVGLFKKRVEAGFIRDCHGDIHSEHIGVEDGIFIFDCIEFNRRFRYSDTVSDAAFLSMDLEFRGRGDLARVFEEGYFSATGDSEGKRLLDFYKCYRAFVRGKVEGFKLKEPEESSEDKKDALLKALLYFDLSYEYATGGHKSLLLLVCGLAGTGKSTVARLIAEKTGMAIISSDEARKGLFSLPKRAHRYEGFKKGIYSERATDKTYNELVKKGFEFLKSGRSVILDATFSKNTYIKEASIAAKKAKADFKIIECVSDDAVIKARLKKRLRDKTSISDATWDIYLKQKEIFERIKNPDIRLSTDKPDDEIVETAIKDVLTERP